MSSPSPLSALVSTASVRPLKSGTDATPHPQLARLASVFMVLAMGCGLWGFALLVRDFSESTFAASTVALWGFATGTLVWVSATWLGNRAWAGALIGLGATALGAYCVRDELAAQTLTAWESMSSWVLTNDDLTVLVGVLFALLGIVVGLSIFAWHAGWVLSLAAMAILALCPSEGIEPQIMSIVALVLYTAAALAHGFVERFFAHRASLVVVALALSGCAVAIAIPLAVHLPNALSAPVHWIDDALAQVSSVLPGGSERAERRAAANASAALGGSGIVNRGNLDTPGAQPLMDVVLSRPLDQTLYLAHFHGGAYGNGRWEAAADPTDLPLEQGATMFAAIPNNEVLNAASFFAASAWVLNGQDAVVASITTSSPSLNAAQLRPYAALAVTPSDGSAPTAAAAFYGFAPLGTYDLLCAQGILDPQLPIGWASEPTGYASDVHQGAQQILNAYLPEAYTRFLTVPTEELPRLSELVAANPQTTVGDAVAFVQETLATHATYTTTPGTYPADVDIAEYLLFEAHAGYCQQFATAATLMLRMYGIPARYVTGLAAPTSAFAENPGEGWSATLGVARAHAWVEIYTDRLGWVPVEVTPAGAQQAAPNTSDPANPSANDEPTEPETPPSTEEESENPATPEEPEVTAPPETTPEEPEPEGSAPEENTVAAPRIAWVPLILALLAAAALVCAAAVAIRHRRRALLARREQASAEGLLADLVALLHAAHLMTDWNGTEDAFAQELSRTIPAVRTPQAEHLVAEALAAAFGGAPQPPVADEEARAVYDTVCGAIYDELGLWQRAVCTWVHGFR